MKEMPVAPINHSATSAFGTTVAEAGRSSLSGLWKGGLLGIGLTAALFGGGAALAGASAAWILGVAALGTLGVATLAAVGVPFIGGLITVGAGLGTLIGAVKGTSHGVDRVGKERGAAAMVNAQIEAVRAQNSAPNIYVQPASYGYPAQGSPMNPASPRIYAANDNAYAQEAARATAQGTVDAAQQQAAR